MFMSNNKYMKDDKKTDDLVERIAQRVLDKLEGLTPSEHIPELDCQHLKTGCINCGLCIIKNQRPLIISLKTGHHALVRTRALMAILIKNWRA